MLRNLRAAFWCSIAIWSAAAGLLLAQTPIAPPSLSAPEDLLREAPPGVCELDGSLWATGPRWRARFVDRGYEFVPGFGAKRADQHQVRYTLEAIGRGGDLAPVAPGNWRHEALRVESRHGEVVARYDVVPEGLQQSFVFDRLPAGRGDLIVRGRLATGLEVVAEGPGLRLSSPSGGSMSIGGVTGIDAKGNRVAGEVRYADGVLDLVLPAAFVENAALPLVLDPLVGGVISLSAIMQSRPRVAYDVSTDRWLVVGNYTALPSISDVRGKLIDGNGGLTGGTIFVGPISTFRGIGVANVRLRSRFIVVYTQANDIKARSVSAADGSMSAEITIAGTADLEDEPVIAGEATLVDNDAICVWRNVTRNTIEGAQISVASSGALSVFGRVTLVGSQGGAPQNPKLPKSCGRNGVLMLAYEVPGATPNEVDAMACVLDRNLAILRSGIAVATGTADQRVEGIDGDGFVWSIKYGTWLQSCTWDRFVGNVRFGAPVSVGAGVSALVSTGSSAVLASGFTTLSLAAADPFSCLPCESPSAYSLPSPGVIISREIDGCGAIAGGGSEDRAMFAHSVADGTGEAGYYAASAHLWRSADGLVADLGGGCGEDAGQPYATCARAGNAQFTPRLLSAAPTAPALFVISRDVLGLPCGGCRLQPDPYTGFAIPTATDSAGDALVPIPIPNLPAVVGLPFVTQWVVAEPVTPGCFQFGADLSRAFRITIE